MKTNRDGRRSRQRSGTGTTGGRATVLATNSNWQFSDFARTERDHPISPLSFRLLRCWKLIKFCCRVTSRRIASHRVTSSATCTSIFRKWHENIHREIKVTYRMKFIKKIRSLGVFSDCTVHHPLSIVRFSGLFSVPANGTRVSTIYRNI